MKEWAGNKTHPELGNVADRVTQAKVGGLGDTTLVRTKLGTLELKAVGGSKWAFACVPAL